MSSSNQTTVLVCGIGAAAAALSLCVYLYYSYTRQEGKGKSQSRPRISGAELRRARLLYLEKNQVQAGPEAEDGYPGYPQPDFTDGNADVPESEVVSSSGVAADGTDSSAVGGDVVGGASAKPRALSLSAASPAESSVRARSSSRSPTSPARALFSKRRNSVVATQSNFNTFHSNYLCAPHPPIADPSFDEKTGAPVINPIRSVEEVLKWTPGFDEFSVAWRSLRRRSVDRRTCDGDDSAKRARLLVCHDMQGGYLDDRLCQGAFNNDPAYYLPYWEMIDTFVYFSHHLVTLPPPTWTNAAHLHGVPVLGTFITEWHEGSEVCTRFLSSVESAHQLAEKLASMAQYYRFDGWLINIENEIDEESVPVMCEFLQHLTRQVHATVGAHGSVLWYDSVTRRGKLQWQDALNDENKMFYHSCDGIFLNYTWTEEKLERSHQSVDSDAEALDRVFVGIDAFGRGCPGGGGFRCIDALETVTNHGFSAALFAFGWVWEKLGKEEFAANSEKFWKLLSPKCMHFCPADLPLCSSFGLGMGKSLFINGKAVSRQPWLHLSSQDLQPNALEVRSSAFLDLDPVGMDTSEAFGGGHSLVISGRTCLQTPANAEQVTSRDCACVRLYSTEISVSHPLVVTLVHSVRGPVDVALSLFVNLPDGQGVQLVLPAVAQTDLDDPSKKELDTLDVKLRERYRICRSPSLNNTDSWLVDGLIRHSEPPSVLSSRRPSTSESTPVSASSSVSNLSVPGTDALSTEGVSPLPYPSSASSSASSPQCQLTEGFAALRGQDQALLDSLSTGVAERDGASRRLALSKWKMSHFLIAGHHVKSFCIRDVALLCRPELEDGKTSSSSSSVDREDSNFQVKLGEIRLAEARWLRSEFLESAFALRCGGVQWQLCPPSVLLRAPKPTTTSSPFAAAAHLSVSGCSASHLDMTLLWDHPAPLSVAWFDVYVHGLEEHRLCIHPDRPAAATATVTTVTKSSSSGDVRALASGPSLPHVTEEDELGGAAASSAATANASTASPLSSMSAQDISIIHDALQMTPGASSGSGATTTTKVARASRAPLARAEYLGRAYGLSYHVSRLPLVVKAIRPSPDLFRKTTSLLAAGPSAAALSTSKLATSGSPSPRRHGSQSTPVTPTTAPATCPPQHIWFTVQPVSRARLRRPLDKCSTVCLSWS